MPYSDPTTMHMPLLKTPPLTAAETPDTPESGLRADAPKKDDPEAPSDPEPSGLLTRLRHVIFPTRKKTDDSLRDVLEDYIESLEDKPGIPVTGHEKSILSNVLELRDLKVSDVMIPRADIVALDISTPFPEALAFIAARPLSRYPVFRNTMDDIAGTIHIKDILTKIAASEPVILADLVRDVPIVSPALSVVDLLLLMRESRKHMALVVDEYGGIDGLVTIGDITESIIGEIDDEFDPETDADMVVKPDGSLIVDARVDIETFEEQVGPILSEDERENVDTVGGLASALAGHVPSRGEMLSHPSGAIFEVLDADPRRVKRLRIRNLPRREG